MSAVALRRRGQPLAVLLLLLAGWIVVRAVVWETPFAERPARRDPVLGLAAPPPLPARPSATAGASAAAATAAPARPAGVAAARLAAGWTPAAAAAATAVALLPPLAEIPPRATPSPSSPVTAAAAAPEATLPSALPAGGADGRSRWSGDAWVLLRPGRASLVPAAGRASYGGSQAGAVLRYSLGVLGGHAPAAYARLSRALGFDDQEAALGLSARPLAGVPLRLLAEARVQQSGGATRLRPAATLVTELPPQPLPLGAEGEIYAQAGYVGGAAATPFFDAQATAERPLAQLGPAVLHLGGGAWAGGQEGATRLDLGPRASLRLALDPVAARLALDWRFRIAGDADPGSGPTLTFAAGF